jgi:hypothetical protein
VFLPRTDIQSNGRELASVESFWRDFEAPHEIGEPLLTNLGEPAQSFEGLGDRPNREGSLGTVGLIVVQIELNTRPVGSVLESPYRLVGAYRLNERFTHWPHCVQPPLRSKSMAKQGDRLQPPDRTDLRYIVRQNIVAMSGLLSYTDLVLWVDLHDPAVLGGMG